MAVNGNEYYYKGDKLRLKAEEIASFSSTILSQFFNSNRPIL
jgi:hypothetical protein